MNTAIPRSKRRSRCLLSAQTLLGMLSSCALMHPSDLNRIRREIWRLTLAEHDMRLVAGAADELRGSDDLLEVYPPSLVLEAGLVIVYCRSFSGPPKPGRRPQHIVDELAPQIDLHTKLWELRNKLYGHSDEDYDDRRDTVDIFGEHSYEVEYRHMNRDILPRIKALALEFAETCRLARESREQSLRDAGVEPDRWWEEGFTSR